MEMNDDEDEDENHSCAIAFDVDIGDDKTQMFAGPVASRHVHDKDDDQVSVSSVEHEGNGNGIGSFGEHVPVGSRIDMSESEDHDVGSFDESNVRGSDPSSSSSS